MSIKISQNKSLNFTGRKKIKLKDAHLRISVEERKKNSLLLDLLLDRQKTLSSVQINDDESIMFILEAFFHGTRQRIEFDKYGKPSTDEVDNCPDRTNPTFRLLIVRKGNDAGKILAATTFFTAKENDDANEAKSIRRNDFFDLKRSESLEGQAWSVDWASDLYNPRIMFNARLLDAEYSGDNKFIRFFVFPEILREILNGMVFRCDDFESIRRGSKLEKWKLFCEQKLGTDFDKNIDESLDKIEWINNVVVEFVNKNWANDKTLLEVLVK